MATATKAKIVSLALLFFAVQSFSAMNTLQEQKIKNKNEAIEKLNADRKRKKDRLKHAREIDCVRAMQSKL